MRSDKIIELATYILVALAMWVVSPLLGKFIDSFYFHYPNIFADSVPIILIGIVVTLTGAALAIWTIVLFKIIGKGTPNPKLPPRVFVVSGPYRFSRNPMALGGLLILLGEAVVYYSPTLLGIAVLYGIIIYLYVMFVEEPVLKKRFGESYDDYFKRVPRFFPNPWKWYK
jgi:protein-S-isoprenylcysteine O-methyltransferase Ste14